MCRFWRRKSRVANQQMRNQKFSRRFGIKIRRAGTERQPAAQLHAVIDAFRYWWALRLGIRRVIRATTRLEPEWPGDNGWKPSYQTPAVARSRCGRFNELDRLLSCGAPAQVETPCRVQPLAGCNPLQGATLGSCGPHLLCGARPCERPPARCAAYAIWRGRQLAMPSAL
jgi:hypothetical protein